MALYTLPCQGCGKRALVDDDDESRFCMHCGCRLDCLDGASPVEEPICSILMLPGILGEGDTPVEDYSDRPWSSEVDRMADQMMAGNTDAAVQSCLDLIAGHPDDKDVVECIRNTVLRRIVDSISDGTPYSGGAGRVLKAALPYTEDDGPHVMLESMLYGFSDIMDLMDDARRLHNLALTLYNITVEIPQTENDLREMRGICSDFIEISDTICGLAGKLATGDELAESIERDIRAMQEFMDILAVAIDESADDDGRMDLLAAAWAEAGMIGIGTDVQEAALGFLEGAIDGDEAMAVSRRYVGEYLSK